MSGAARILEVAELDFVLEPGPWPFAIQRAAEIADHWRKRVAAMPKLFDGKILLLRRHEFMAREGGGLCLRGAYTPVDFRAFLAWRDFGFPDAGVANCFSMAALRGADGGFVLGEMAAHTANAGQIYFPAGTPDMQDVAGGRVDLFAGARRELFEETGIAPGEAQFAPGWSVVCAPPRIACMKLARVETSAAALKARIEAFLAGDREAELALVHIVRAIGDIDAARTPTFVARYLEAAFAQSAAG